MLPAVAMAKVSMRLVPNQDPKKIGDLFEEYVKKVTPKTVELKITRMHGGKPWMTAFDNPFVQAAGRAIEQGFGQRPVFNREGGSIPVVSTFQEELGVPCVLFGVGLPDENAHAPDEKLDLGNFHNGVIASAYLYKEIGGSRNNKERITNNETEFVVLFVLRVRLCSAFFAYVSPHNCRSVSLSARATLRSMRHLRSNPFSSVAINDSQPIVALAHLAQSAPGQRQEMCAGAAGRCLFQMRAGRGRRSDQLRPSLQRWRVSSRVLRKGL